MPSLQFSPSMLKLLYLDHNMLFPPFIVNQDADTLDMVTSNNEAEIESMYLVILVVTFPIIFPLQSGPHNGKETEAD